MNTKEKNSIIELLKSEVDEDYKLANNIIKELDISFEELEEICKKAEEDSRFYYVATRNKEAIKLLGFWNKIDCIWKEKK